MARSSRAPGPPGRRRRHHRHGRGMAVAVIAAVSSQQALWYLTRSTGLVSLLLLTASVVLGVTEVTRWASAQFPRFVTAALHRNVSLLAVAFVGVHIASAVLDGYAPIGWL